MTLAELLNEAQLRLDDFAGVRGWSEAELIAWINEAQREAAQRGLLLSSTFVTSIVAGTASYVLDPAIWLVEQVESAMGGLLTLVRHADLENSVSAWASVTGTPRMAFVSGDGTTLTLYPKPTDADTLSVRAWFDPDPLVNPSDTPMISPRHHRALLEWVCYRAGQKRDVDHLLPDAERYLANFERHFGPSASAVTVRGWNDYRPTGTCAMPT